MSIEALDFKIVKIHRFEQGDRIKAFVDLGVNDALLIRGLKVIKGPKGLFVSMPQEQGRDDRWFDKVRCMKAEVREQISRKVLDAYKKNS